MALTKFKARCCIVFALLLLTLSPAPGLALERPNAKSLSSVELDNEVERRAFRFFWEQSDLATGLTLDRACNTGSERGGHIASVSSTGYALASLPVAVERRWVSREEAYIRARQTLRFLHAKLPNEHGWFYHFVDGHTGQRAWNCELSSIDTAILVTGALMCGQYWRGTEVDRLANSVYDRVDWTWMRTNGGTQPDKRVLCMGWNPEHGFLPNNWDRYCELMTLYLLGLGSRTSPLPESSWTAWERNKITYRGHETLTGGPIFLHEMAQAFFDFRNQRDRLGWNYWNVSREAVRINRQFCMDNASHRKTYSPDIWGLNADDYPGGYKAFSAPGDEDGTVSPTGAIAAILFEPALARSAERAIYYRYGDKIWGRYGFADAFNVDQAWYDPDVIGIDLGMVLVAIEDVRTGLPWKLLASHPSLHKAWKRAGFHSSTGTTLQYPH